MKIFVLNKRLSDRLKEAMKVKASLNNSKAVPSNQLKATDYSKPDSCIRLEMLREAIVEVLKPNAKMGAAGTRGTSVVRLAARDRVEDETLPHHGRR